MTIYENLRRDWKIVGPLRLFILNKVFDCIVSSFHVFKLLRLFARPGHCLACWIISTCLFCEDLFGYVKMKKKTFFT